MSYRNPLIEDAQNHMIASAGEFGWFSGYHGATRKLSGERRFKTSKFSQVTVSVISNKHRTQVMTFPSYPIGKGASICDYSNPIGKWDMEGCHGFFKDEDLKPFIDDAIAKSISCDNPQLELAYLLAYIER